VTNSESGRLAQLENESIYIIREAFRTLPKLAMLWSMGKDSSVMLWLTRKAFFGRVPFPVVHIDTSYKISEMIAFRELMAKEWGLDLRVSQNRAALEAGMNPGKGKLECCTALKTEALKSFLREQDFRSIFAAIRLDEEGSRGKERVFSPRGEGSSWNYREQPPQFWNEYQTDVVEGTEMRVHPILNWTELDIWLYIRQQKIPVLGLYFAVNGRRYRSVGCAPCTGSVESNASTLDEIIEELRTTRIGERTGRAQDQADRYAMQKLRARGYM
jgi:sulfate adenylyltransferase subunit 2